MKRKTKFAALALVISLALSCCIVPAMAQEESTATEDASIADSEDNANSWRYSNGEPIHQTANSTFSAIETLSTTYTTWPILNNAVAYGIDVSHHQGYINWTKVQAAGVDYAIIRCGYTGNTSLTNCFTDSYWKTNAAACEAVGISYGVYYYSCATTVDQAKKEAEYVLSLVEGRTLTYPIYYDLEDDSLLGLTSTELAAIAETFCSTIEAAGYTVGVYANLDWWTNRLTSSVFDQWERWIAQWNTACDYEGTYTMWQLSDVGSVDGISGDVDLNIDLGAALQSSTATCTTHNYVAGEQTAATCTVDGSITYTCSVCGGSYTDTDTLTATGHVESEAVTESGSSDTVVYCTACGVELSRVTNTTGATDTVEDTASTTESSDDGSGGEVGEGGVDNDENADSNAVASDPATSESVSGDEAGDAIYTTDDNAGSADTVEGTASTTESSDDGSGDEANEGGVDNAENSAEDTGSETDTEGVAVLYAAAEEEEGSESEDDDDISEDDDATATSSADTPSTGDTTNTMVWVISLLMAATVSVMIIMSYRRRTRRAKQIADIVETFDRIR